MNEVIVIEVPNRFGRKALYLGDTLILEHHPNDGDYASLKLNKAATALAKSLGKNVFKKQFVPVEGQRAFWEDIFPVVQSQVESLIECLRDTFTLQFDVTGTVSQEIEIMDQDYSYDDILDGLKVGILTTTTYYDRDVNQPAYISTLEDKLVARIVSQEMEGSYTEFEIPN